MKINRLITRGFKGPQPDRDLALSGLDLFVGPNGSGKSSVLEAVQVAMRGYLPALGGRVQDTWMLKHPASEALVASIVMDGNRTLASRVHQVGKSLSLATIIDGEPVPAAGAHARRAELVGDFAPMFNLGDFLDLSDARKLDFLAGLVSGSGGGDLPAALAAGLALTEAQRASEILARETGRLRAEIAGAETPLAGLAAYQERAHRAFLDGRQALQRIRTELQGLATSGAAVPASAIADLESKRQEHLRLAGDLQRQIGHGEQAATTYQARARRLEALQRAIADAKVKALEPLTPEQRAENEAARAAAMSRCEALRAQWMAKDAAIAEARAILTGVDGSECPTCRQPMADGWRDVIEARIEALAEERDDLRGRLAVDETIARCAGEELDGDERARQWRADLDRDEADLAQLQAELGEAPNLEMLRDNLAGAQSVIAEIDSRLDAARADESRARRRAELGVSLARTEEEQTILEALDKGARELIHKTVRDSSVAIAAIVQELLTEVGDLQFALDFDDKNVMQMGLLRGGDLVPFSSLSGGEAVLVSCALATALIVLADPPVKVLMVEAAEVDGVNVQGLLTGLAAMSKHLDNVLVATCHAPLADPLWTVHVCGVEVVA